MTFLLVENTRHLKLEVYVEKEEIKNNMQKSCLQTELFGDHSLAFFQTLNQLFADLQSCNEKHSAHDCPVSPVSGLIY